MAAFCLLVPVLGLGGRPDGFQAQSGPKVSPQQAQTAPATPSQRPGTTSRPDQFLPWEWWKDEAVKKELTLTDGQVRSITRVYEDRARQMKPLGDEFQKQLEALEKLTRERTVEVSVYSIQVTQVEALRTELSKTRAVMLYSIHRMLTPEQYEKLREIRDRRRTGRGSGGPR